MTDELLTPSDFPKDPGGGKLPSNTERGESRGREKKHMHAKKEKKMSPLKKWAFKVLVSRLPDKASSVFIAICINAAGEFTTAASANGT